MSSDDRRSSRTLVYTNRATPRRTSAIAAANTAVRRALTDKPVPHTANGLDAVTTKWAIDLLPDAADIDVDDIRVALVATIPDMAGQAVPPKRDTGKTHQRFH